MVLPVQINEVCVLLLLNKIINNLFINVTLPSFNFERFFFVTVCFFFYYLTFFSFTKLSYTDRSLIFTPSWTLLNNVTS